MLKCSRITRAGLLFALLLPAICLAQNPEPKETEQVIQPEIDRRKVRIPRIDTEDFEIGVYTGILSVEDFGAKPVYGARLVYHVSEDFFVEGMYGKSTISDQALCDLGLCLFPNREEELTYYGLSVGYNVLPGEIFIGRGNAMTSAVYLLAGVGNTSFLDESHFTINVGMGIRVLPVDWLALHLTMRDHLFESDILGTKEIKNNFELTLGLSVYF
jgi:outer membrane beta-barrel protein